MLRIGTKESSEAAKKYFSESLEPGDYYVKDFELPGEWAGKGAQILGLAGEIKKEDFYSLCDNKLLQSDHSFGKGIGNYQLTRKTLESTTMGRLLLLSI